MFCINEVYSLIWTLSILSPLMKKKGLFRTIFIMTYPTKLLLVPVQPVPALAVLHLEMRQEIIVKAFLVLTALHLEISLTS